MPGIPTAPARCPTSSAPGRPASQPRQPSRSSWLLVGTTPTTSTWSTSPTAAGERYPWSARLSPKPLAVLDDLPDHARAMLRDMMDIACRDPWSFPAFDSRDPEGEDGRASAVGHLTAVYWTTVLPDACIDIISLE